MTILAWVFFIWPDIFVEEWNDTSRWALPPWFCIYMALAFSFCTLVLDSMLAGLVLSLV